MPWPQGSKARGQHLAMHAALSSAARPDPTGSRQKPEAGEGGQPNRRAPRRCSSAHIRPEPMHAAAPSPSRTAWVAHWRCTFCLRKLVRRQSLVSLPSPLARAVSGESWCEIGVAVHRRTFARRQPSTPNTAAWCSPVSTRPQSLVSSALVPHAPLLPSCRPRRSKQRVA